MDALTPCPLFSRPSGGPQNAPYVLLLFSPLCTYHQFVYTLYVNFISPLINFHPLASSEPLLEIQNIRYTENNKILRINDEESWIVALGHVHAREFMQQWGYGAWNPMMVEFDIVPVNMNATSTDDLQSKALEKTFAGTLTSSFSATDWDKEPLKGISPTPPPSEKEGTQTRTRGEPLDLYLSSADPAILGAYQKATITDLIGNDLQPENAFLNKYTSLVSAALADLDKSPHTSSKNKGISGNRFAVGMGSLKIHESYLMARDSELTEVNLSCLPIGIGLGIKPTIKQEGSIFVREPQSPSCRIAKRELSPRLNIPKPKAEAFLAAINEFPLRQLHPWCHPGLGGALREIENDPDFGRLERPSLSPLPMRNLDLPQGFKLNTSTTRVLKVTKVSINSQSFKGKPICTLTIRFSTLGRSRFRSILRNTRHKPRCFSFTKVESSVSVAGCRLIANKHGMGGVSVMGSVSQTPGDHKFIAETKSQKSPHDLIALSSRFTHEKNWVTHPIPSPGIHNTRKPSSFPAHMKVRFRRSSSVARTVDIIFLMRTRATPMGVSGISFDPEGEVSVTFRIDIVNFRLKKPGWDSKPKLSIIEFWAELGADGNRGYNLDMISGNTDIAAMFGTLEGLAGVGVDMNDSSRKNFLKGCWVRVSFTDNGDILSMLQDWGAI